MYGDVPTVPADPPTYAPLYETVPGVSSPASIGTKGAVDVGPSSSSAYSEEGESEEDGSGAGNTLASFMSDLYGTEALDDGDADMAAAQRRREAIRRMAAGERAQVGEIKPRAASSATLGGTSAWARGEGAVDPYALSDHIRSGGASSALLPQTADEQTPPAAHARVGAFLASLVTSAASPKKTVGRAVRSAQLRSVRAADMPAVVEKTLRIVTPLSEWRERGLDIDEDGAVWDALDGLAAAPTGGPLLPRLARCGWTVRTVLRDPRPREGSHLSLWTTLLEWGFTGAEVATPRSPWMEPLALTTSGVGLRKLAEKCAVTIDDLIAGGMSAGTLGQFSACDGLPSPVPYLVLRMRMTARSFVALGYSLEEWVSILGLTRAMLDAFELLCDAKANAELRYVDGWSRAALVEVLAFTPSEAEEVFPKKKRKARPAQHREWAHASVPAWGPPPGGWKPTSANMDV